MLRPSRTPALAQHDGEVIASGRRGGHASDPATRHALDFVVTSFASGRMLRPSRTPALAQHDGGGRLAAGAPPDSAPVTGHRFAYTSKYFPTSNGCGRLRTEASSARRWAM
jgi:hypothetical protein